MLMTESKKGRLRAIKNLLSDFHSEIRESMYEEQTAMDALIAEGVEAANINEDVEVMEEILTDLVALDEKFVLLLGD